MKVSLSVLQQKTKNLHIHFSVTFLVGTISLSIELIAYSALGIEKICKFYQLLESC